jgi:aspartyl-tRNA(Asn)/glutamyl-tRNA(Gln) amidotransferase subunit A
VRIPAAFCGLVGLKPTHDRLPIEGYPSVAPSMDVPGPIARTVEDCALLWHVLAHDTPAPAFAPLTSSIPPRIGLIRELGPELSTRAVREAFARTLHLLACGTEIVSVPLAPYCAGIGMMTASHEVATGPHAARPINEAGRLTLALGRALSDAGRARLRMRRAALREQCLAALARVGFLAMPTSAIPAPAITREILAGGQDGILLRAVGLYSPLANVTGLPAIAVPMGADDRGRPLSIMFMGPPNSERELLQIALAVQERQPG